MTFELRPFEKATLKNGMKVFFVKDNSLPYISFYLLVHSGQAHSLKSGLPYLVCDLLDKGVKGKSSEELSEEIEILGSYFAPETSEDYTLCYSQGLSRTKKELFKIFYSLITEPSFLPKEVEKLKKRTVSELRSDSDDHTSWASHIFDQYLFKGTPYKRPPSGKIEDVSKIQRKDILSFYKKHYHPSNVSLAVVGDMDSSFQNQVKKKFASWGEKKPVLKPLPRNPLDRKKETLLVNKPEMQQTQIRLGQRIHIKRSDKDYLALQVASQILGGGFGSHLITEVRVKRGLTYRIYSGITPHKNGLGALQIATFTKHEKVKETLDIINEVLKNFYKKGVTKEELNIAKNFLKGQFPYGIETADALSIKLLTFDFLGMDGKERLLSFLKRLDRLTQKEVNEAIRRHLDPEKIQTLLFTSENKVKSQLKGIKYKKKDYKMFL